MIDPDMRTIVFSFAIVEMAVTLEIVVLCLQNHKRFKGMNSWLTAFLLQTMAGILIAHRGYIPDWISIDVSNTMIIAGMLAGLVGMCRFMGITMNHIHNYVIVVIFAVVQTWFTFAVPDLSARTINLAIAMLLFSVQYSWLIFYRASGNIRKIAAGIGIVFVAYLAINMLRIIYFLTYRHISKDYFQADAFEKFVFIVYQVLLIFLAYSLALMYNRRLISEIATQEEKFSKAFQSSPYAILITRFSDGKIIEVNRGFTKITGYNYKDVIGNTTNRLHIWIEDNDRSEFIRELTEGGIYEKEKQFKVSSGQIVTALLSAEMIMVNDEKLIIASINDISEQKKNESLLKEKVADLERMNKFMIGRELRMIELKQEINELCDRLGFEKRY